MEQVQVENTSPERTALRIILPAVLTVALFAFVLWLFYLPTLEQTAMERKREMTRELTNAALSVIARYHEQAEAGIMSAEEAKALALNSIRDMRYGTLNKDYFWINDVNGRMLAHPYRPELEGANVNNLADPDGKFPFREFIKTAKAGGGFVKYKWQWLDRADKVEPKLSYVGLFKPWGWVVGTGAYIDDVERQINEAKLHVTVGFGVAMLLVAVLCMYMVRQAVAAERRLKALAREREEVAELCRHSEQNLRVIMDSMHDGVIIHTLEGEIVGVNQQMLEMFDMVEEQIAEFPHIQDYCDPGSPLEELGALWDRVMAGEKTVLDWQARRPADNSTFDAEVVLTGIVLDGSDLILACVRDITRRKRTENELRIARQRLRDVALTSGDWLWEVDIDGRYTYASGRVKEITGYDSEEILKMTCFDLMPEDEVERIGPMFKEALRKNDPIFDLENKYVAKDGRPGIFLTNGVPVLDRDEKVIGFFGVDKDITARKEAEQKLKLFEQVFENALEGISITDKDGRIVAVNPAFTEITGFEAGEVLGQNPRILKSDRHDKDFYQAMWSSITRDGHWSGEIWNRRKNGEPFPEWLSISAIRENGGGITHYVAVFHDITEMKRKEDQIRHQAYHDALTNLPNRLLLKDRLRVAISHAKRNNRMVGVLFIDLDNFKNINDSLGHAAGDELLKEVAERFKPLVRESDTVSRLGGDEFVIMVEDLESESFALQLAQRVLGETSAPFFIDGHELFITTSIGITVYPEDGEEPETLIKNADTAMYRAKSQGKNTYRMFMPEMNERIIHRLTLESKIRKALDNDEFYLKFQPRIGLTEKAVVGMEALARWRNPEDEEVLPAEFIPLAEETGLIVPLGEAMLLKACEHGKTLLQDGGQSLNVSVNISPRQFEQTGLVQRISDILSETGLPARNLELEITEGTLMTNIERSIRLLGDIADLGVTISIDDFGTGYSSLYYLKQFPIQVLKIDKSFVRDMTEDANDANLISTILLMAKYFDMRVVAEGVETKAQLDFLASAGCDEIQGFYIAEPFTPQEFALFLNSAGWREKLS